MKNLIKYCFALALAPSVHNTGALETIDSEVGFPATTVGPHSVAVHGLCSSCVPARNDVALSCEGKGTQCVVAFESTDATTHTVVQGAGEHDGKRTESNRSYEAVCDSLRRSVTVSRIGNENSREQGKGASAKC